MEELKSELIKKITDAADYIYRKSLDPNYNWIIVNSEFIKKLENFRLRTERKEKLLEIESKNSKNMNEI